MLVTDQTLALGCESVLQTACLPTSDGKAHQISGYATCPRRCQHGATMVVRKVLQTSCVGCFADRLAMEPVTLDETVQRRPVQARRARRARHVAARFRHELGEVLQLEAGDEAIAGGVVRLL